MHNTQHDAALAALDAQHRQVTSAKAAALADRDRMSLQLANAPNDTILAGDLEAVEVELAQYERDLQRLAGARRALIAQNEANTITARRAALERAKQACTKAASERLKAAKAIEKSLEQLGEALEAEGTAGAAAWAHLLEATHLACGDGDSSAGVNAALGLQGAAQGGVASTLGALHRALQRGQAVGSKVAASVTVHLATDHGVTPSAEAASDLERLTDGLSSLSVPDLEQA